MRGTFLAGLSGALAEHQEARESDGWIKWRGGNCPVGLGTMSVVEVKLRLGKILVGQADHFLWDWEGEKSSESDYDIVAYRVVRSSWFIPATPAMREAK